jgi:hypothetical protein
VRINTSFPQTVVQTMHNNRRPVTWDVYAVHLQDFHGVILCRMPWLSISGDATAGHSSRGSASNSSSNPLLSPHKNTTRRMLKATAGTGLITGKRR